MKNFQHKFLSINEFSKDNNTLGDGAFGKVKLMRHIKTNKLFAVKEINIEKVDKLDWINLEREIHFHKNLDHPYIIRFEDFIKDSKFIYIILEYARNGDLFSYINRNPNMSIKEITRIFKQVTQGFAYIHNKNIIHRDLKPENILLDKDFNVKICDFGWSAEYYDNIKRDTFCGTYEYMAPEVLLKKTQSTKTDIWSLGILLYELTHGKAPFEGRTQNQVKEKIEKNRILFKKSIDPKIKNLILNILKINPKERPSAKEILKNELFEEEKTNIESRNFLKEINLNRKFCNIDRNLKVNYERNYSNKKVITTTIKSNYHKIITPTKTIVKKIDFDLYSKFGNNQTLNENNIYTKRYFQSNYKTITKYNFK